MTKSMYIHIPFCKRICSYCDFPKVLKYDCYIDRYLESLKEEIDNYYKGEIISTLYIGGGTPSCLSKKELKKLFNILDKIKKDKKIEYTIECNIDDIDEEFLMLIKQNGINRLSIGIQTFDNNILKYLNREEVIDINKIVLSKKYFDNINIDLMYAIPASNIEILKDDLTKIIKLNINHVSCYSLILEERTKLYIDKEKTIDEELDYEMYKLIERTLEANDYIHYETSNYAKKGYESKHNLVYWNNEHYYGFGLKASGYIDDIRYTNTGNLTRYLNKDFDRKIELLSDNDKMEYEMILGLRKLNGVSKKIFKAKYGIDIKDKYDIARLLKENRLKENDDYIYINKDYIYLSNEILINFV